MINLTKKDIVSALITGLITGFSAWRVAIFLDKPPVFEIPYAYLLFIIPLCWVAGVWFGHFMGRWVNFFHQFGRFVAIGFTNFAVDLGTLYLLIGLTGRGEAGVWFTIYRSMSGAVAVVNSFIWNKFWAFEAGSTGGGAGEIARFLGVISVTLLINVGVASFIVNFVPPLAGFNPTDWAGIANVAGSACGLLFTFIGLRLAVFKK